MEIKKHSKDSISDYEYLLFYESICKNPYIPYKPYPKQSWPIYEANRLTKRTDNNGKCLHNHVLAGAGGFGGKTYLGSMLAAQYLTEDDYSCLVTRKNYTELIGIDSIFQNLVKWTCDENLKDEACTKVEGKLIRIRSPVGAEIHFKAFDREDKKQKIKSESYDRIINDEASELDPRVLSFQHRSLRQSIDSKIPLSIINLSNPGGPSTEYLIDNYINPDSFYPYIALDWRDNPYINRDDYEASLDELDYIDQQYQKYGNWHYRPNKGDLFDQETLEKSIIKEEISDDKIFYTIMSVDLASTGRDMTSISLVYLLKNNIKILMDLDEESSPYPEEMIYSFLEKHNPADEEFKTDLLVFEQEPGSDFHYSLIYWKNELRDYIERGLRVRLYKPVKSKYQRARPLSREINNNKFFFTSTIKNRITRENNTNTLLIDKLFNQLISLDPEENNTSPDLVDSITQANNYLDKLFKKNNKKARIIV